jgi:hypothetical protein
MAPMIAFRNVGFLASAGLVILVGFSPFALAQTGSADLPPDVMRLIGRRSSCLEWSQKAFDIERKTQLDDVMSILRSLKCDEAANDETALRQKYTGNSDILRALDSTWVKVVKRLPVRIPVAPDPNR